MKAVEAFNSYVAAYDPSDIMISSKIEHTMKVAENAERIARSEGLLGDDAEFASGPLWVKMMEKAYAVFCSQVYADKTDMAAGTALKANAKRTVDYSTIEGGFTKDFLR